MGLIHWWPLNGNTNDIGVRSPSSGSSGGTINNSGKIGKCYENNSSAYTFLPYTCDTTGDFSVAFWIKIPTSMSGNSGWEQTFRFDAVVDNDTSSVCCFNWADYQNFKIPDTARHQYWWLAPGRDFYYDVWFHVAVIFKEENGGNRTRLYINGVQYGSDGTSNYILRLRSGNVYLGNGITVGSVYYNDVRIYDHALSAKEVKEISKGLVLHYPFNDPYIEGTTNLNSANWNPYSAYWTISSQTANEITLVSQGTGHGTVAIYNESVRNQLSANTTYTISGYLYRDGVPYKCTDSTLTPYDGWVTSRFESRDDGFFSYTGYFTNPSDIWIIHTPLFGAPESGVVCKIKDMQWEQKDHATPYVNGTRAPGIIYDSSGYRNNGVQVNLGGYLQVSGDTCSGLYSAVFNSQCAIDAGTSAMVGPYITVNLFAYRDNWTDSERYAIASCTEGGGWNFNNNDVANSMAFLAYRDGYGYAAPNFLLSEMTPGWHMLTGVVGPDGTKIYLDGVLKDTNSYTGTLTYPDSHIFVGAEANGSSALNDVKFPGKIADFKIYATALSQEDILLEYNRKASIDRNGNLYTGEFVSSNSKTNIDKNNVVYSAAFVEGDTKTKIFGGYTQLEHIQSSGTQYIDANITLDNEFEIILDQMNNFDTNNHYMVGSGTGGKMLGTLGNVIWCNGVIYSSVGFDRNVRQTLGIQIVSDGSSYSDVVCTNYTTNTRYSGRSSYYVRGGGNVFVFNVNGHSGAESFKCYDCKIFKSGVLVRHFIPAKRNKDNVIGMFDLIEGKFYINSGTGSFIAGPELGDLSVIHVNELSEI